MLTIRLTNGQKDKINEYYKQEGKNKVNLCNFIEWIAVDFVEEYRKAKREGKEDMLQLDLLRFNVPRKPANIKIDVRYEKDVTTHLCLLDDEIEAFKGMAFSLGFSTADLIRRLVDRKLSDREEEEYKLWEAKQKEKEKNEDKSILKGQIDFTDLLK